MRLIDAVLTLFGYVPKALLEGANKRNAVYKEQLERIKAQLSTANSATDDKSRKVLELEKKLKLCVSERDKIKAEVVASHDQIEWCRPEIVELPQPPATPQKFYDRTVSALRFLLKSEKKSIFDTCQICNFKFPAQWSLYWIFTHAAHATAEAAKAPLVEDKLSDIFIEELKKQAAKLSDLTGPEALIDIAVDAIYDHRSPAVKEKTVGADVLLLVSGSQLIPNGGTRLFWLQAKRAEDDSENKAYKLHYARGNNTGQQFDALRKVHSPGQGSVSLYALYSPALRYVPGIVLGRMPDQAPLAAACVADLAEDGGRLPELLVALTSQDPALGAFSTSGQVISFLNIVSEAKPLYVVMVTTHEPAHTLDMGRRMLQEVTQHYREILGLVQKPRNKHEREPDLGFGQW